MSRLRIAVVALLALAACGGEREPERNAPSWGALAGETPIARLDGETILLDDVGPELGLQVYQHQLDMYALLKRETERIVGERLLERPGGPRAVSLTEAGILLLRHAESIIARLHAAQADMAALQQGHGGRLRVGTFQSVGARVLPVVMRRFLAEWPSVELLLTESPSDEELQRLVERGELDLAFAMTPLADGPFESLELLADPYVLLVPADHELAQLERAGLADLGDLTLIGNRACRSTALAEDELTQRGVSVNVAFRSDDNGTVQGLVGAGFGAALVPLLTVEQSDERVRILELDPEIPYRRIALAWHRDRHRSPAARAFVDVAAEVCREVAGTLARAVA